ncbi:MAG: toll/interleukin-1 receptor domain-containing protein, partial [Gammaproteobacteria bacterium]
LGDSLRRNIDRGLVESRFGVVILSPAFLAKEWPNKELDGLVAREDSREKVILPIWHKVTATDISRFSPILADKLAISTDRGLPVVANSILHAVNDSDDKVNPIQLHASNHERELLARLRTQMLTADSSWGLRQTVYELDEHLAKYPHSPEARLLKDQMVVAMKRAERYEDRAASVGAPAKMAYRASPVRWLAYAIIVAILGFLIYLALSKLL